MSEGMNRRVSVDQTLPSSSGPGEASEQVGVKSGDVHPLRSETALQGRQARSRGQMLLPAPQLAPPRLQPMAHCVHVYPRPQCQARGACPLLVARTWASSWRVGGKAETGPQPGAMSEGLCPDVRAGSRPARPSQSTCGIACVHTQSMARDVHTRLLSILQHVTPGPHPGTG